MLKIQMYVVQTTKNTQKNMYIAQSTIFLYDL